MKVGQVQKMNDEENIWGMWDGVFWSKVEWDTEKQAWIVGEHVRKHMLDAP